MTIIFWLSMIKMEFLLYLHFFIPFIAVLDSTKNLHKIRVLRQPRQISPQKRSQSYTPMKTPSKGRQPSTKQGTESLSFVRRARAVHVNKVCKQSRQYEFKLKKALTEEK